MQITVKPNFQTTSDKISRELLWSSCVNRLKTEMPSQQFNTWIRPLSFSKDSINQENSITLLAPNRFIKDWVTSKFLLQISRFIDEQTDKSVKVLIEVDSETVKAAPASPESSGLTDIGDEPALGRHKLIPAGNSESLYVNNTSSESSAFSMVEGINGPNIEGYSDDSGSIVRGKLRHRGALNKENTFGNFVEGKSNQLARAAAIQVSENPGGSYNPLFIYGGVGLGKTHLMHAIGNELIKKKPGARVVYLHSETFVATMVTALQLNAISEFKRFYRSVDALLIDDIQFFAGKERSQEEFFHTFNALLEGDQQIILTSDRYHKEISGLEERLKSRFGWGLTVAVEPPELETRAAILMNKASLSSVILPNDAAMFIAQRLRSNVRELEGALKRVVAHSNFCGAPISIDLIKEALRDLFTIQDKLVTIDNIQRSVAEYYKIKMSDMLSKRRNRSIARPRQVAMCLAKELTNHSLPEIGDAFGGRDHTTVMHACRQITKLRHSLIDINEDYNNLLRSLSS